MSLSDHEHECMEFLGFVGSLILACVIVGVCWLIYHPQKNNETWRDTCSTVTLSKPDGTPCFPKYHDRSRRP